MTATMQTHRARQSASRPGLSNISDLRSVDLGSTPNQRPESKPTIDLGATPDRAGRPLTRPDFDRHCGDDGKTWPATIPEMDVGVCPRRGDGRGAGPAARPRRGGSGETPGGRPDRGSDQAARRRKDADATAGAD